MNPSADEPTHRTPGDELVEWVDEFDVVIEVVTRRRMRTENLRHRSVSILVMSSDGRLLVHQRSDDKDLLPGWWDVCVGGVVGVGESSPDAAIRELAEELGIELAADATALVDLGRAQHVDSHAVEVSDLYRLVHDGPFRFADGEIAQARFVTPTEFGELVGSHPFLPGSIAMLLTFVPEFAHAHAIATAAAAAGERLRWDTVHRVEFTIEPFIEGQPGPHVTAPIEALAAMGIEAEFGPFGSGCRVEPACTSGAVSAVINAAFENGATHVNIDVTKDET
jgi:isopentenyldiphosphate isomerase